MKRLLLLLLVVGVPQVVSAVDLYSVYPSSLINRAFEAWDVQRIKVKDIPVDEETLPKRAGHNYEQMFVYPDFGISFDVSSEDDFRVMEGESIEIVPTNVKVDVANGGEATFYWTVSEGGLEVLDPTDTWERVANGVRYHAPKISEDERKVKMFVQGGDGVGYIDKHYLEITVIGKPDSVVDDPVPVVRFLEPTDIHGEFGSVCFEVKDIDSEGVDQTAKLRIELFAIDGEDEFSLGQTSGENGCISMERPSDKWLYLLRAEVSDGNSVAKAFSKLRFFPVCRIHGYVKDADGEIVHSGVQLGLKEQYTRYSVYKNYWGHDELKEKHGGIIEFEFEDVRLGGHELKFASATHQIEPVEVFCEPGAPDVFLEVLGQPGFRR